MITQLHKINELSVQGNSVFLIRTTERLKHFGLSKDEINYINQEKEKNIKSITLNRLGTWIFIEFLDDSDEDYKVLEKCRLAGDKLQLKANALKIESISIIDADNLDKYTLALMEGLLLGSYQFIKYKTKPEEHKNTLERIGVYSNHIDNNSFAEILVLVDSVCMVRDMVNEPVCFLNAEKLAETLQNMGKQANIEVEVLNRIKIESLKMGGLLAVNKGSIDPPTFTIMEWKPKNAKNKKPLILVGKGIVFDTGGLNIKTGDHMNTMKGDMAGAASMGAVIYTIAKMQLPIHVIALIPSTDNRPNGNAYTPGDVIKMYDGTTVEVLNTDAEGRMILADALSYAKKYNPMLVVDMATLTGSAYAAIGKFGIVAMGSQCEQEMDVLKSCGYEQYERIAEFPFWDDYAEEIKSDIADIKNIGSRYAGAITAGKFLHHFTDYPWIHLDVAGPAYADAREAYRGLGGTGTGVRLLYHFIKKLVLNK